MILILLAFLGIVSSAQAAEPSTYAVVAPVTVPPTGPVRIALGPDLVGGQPDSLPGGLLLTDASGVAVPYAVLRSTVESAPFEESLNFRPAVASPADGQQVWETDAADLAVDGLRLDIMDLESLGPFTATVQWRRGGVWAGGVEELMYHLNDGTEDRRLDVPHVPGPFRISLRGFGTRPRILGVSTLRELPGFVPPAVETLPVDEPVFTEEGTARYTVRLGGPRAVKSIRLIVPASVDVFERAVRVRRPSADLVSLKAGGGNFASDIAVDYGGNNYGGDTSGSVRRIRVGGGRVDRVEVPVGFSGDTLVLDINTDRGEPLPIEGIEVVSEGAQLLVRDAGAGPHTLYGAAFEVSSPYDLGVAAPELLKADPPLVEAGAASRNPLFVPTPTREGVDSAGPDLTLSRFHFERDIIGGPGWVRVPLGRAVLARTRPDLGDVRVVDSEDRQVPFLLWGTGVEVPWETGPFEREEKGTTTQIRVPLDGTAPVASVLIETSQSVFERNVEILRDAGRSTVAIRRVFWQGPQRGGTLSVAIGERLGDALLIRIENGDNPPIPIESVRVTTPGWELRTRVPEGGARLIYGAPGANRPTYDLYLLEEDVRRLPVPDATLGEERPLTAPKPGVADRGLSVIGIGILAIGLLGMVARVLRGVPGGQAA